MKLTQQPSESARVDIVTPADFGQTSPRAQRLEQFYQSHPALQREREMYAAMHRAGTLRAVGRR